MTEDDTSIVTNYEPLTSAQRARIERNRQKALLLRQARLVSRPYQDPHGERSLHKHGQQQPVDMGGGFFIEDDTNNGESPSKNSFLNITEAPAPLQFVDKLFCNDCQKEIQDSYLFNHFDEAICDSCRKNDDKYELITRSRAKDEFLLKDVDLDKREPPLKYITKRNPHKSSWGDMRLYLFSQIKARAMMVWGSEDALERQREIMEENRQRTKQKKFDKKVKELRNAVRSSIWRKDISSHEHTYDNEKYNEDDDVYTKTCTECGHTLSFEKM